MPYHHNQQTDTRALPLLHLIPGLELLKHNRKGPGLFLFFSFLSYLFVILLQWDLVLISFRSLASAAILLLTAPSALHDVFSIEIVEFWMAAIAVVTIPLALLAISVKTGKRAAMKSAGHESEASSLGSISLQAFMQNVIAQSAAAVIFVLYSVAFLAPLLAPFSPYDQQDFLVTAYKPPFTRLEALVLAQPKIQALESYTATGATAKLAYSLISDLRTLKTRNEPHALRFTDGYSIKHGIVSYRQGMRTRTMPVAELADSSGARPSITRTFILGTDQYG
ncbi:MAG: ABC transporter permease, partial [Chlorobi bacterium]|nr:ABC transporter permease [Chlorobiota bacterium]